MRYGSVRKYPITHMKKALQVNNTERFVDMSLGAALGVLAITFVEGIFWGYMLRKSRK